MGNKNNQNSEALQLREQQDLEMLLAIIRENFGNITTGAGLIRVTGFTETDCTRLFVNT